MPATYQSLITPLSLEANKAALLTKLYNAGFTGAYTWQTGSSPLSMIETFTDTIVTMQEHRKILAEGGLNESATGDTLTVHSDQVYDNQRQAGRYTKGKLLLTDAFGGGPYRFAAEAVSFSTGRGSSLIFHGYGGTVELPRSGTLLIDIISDAPGAAFSTVPANTITYFSRNVLPGVTVTNQADWLASANAQVGTDDESDERIRTRNRTKWEVPGAGSSRGAYEYWAKTADPQVKRVAVLSNIDMLDPGTATVLIAGDSGALGGAVVAAVQNAISPAQIGGEKIPETARAVVASAANLVVTISGTVYVQREYNTSTFQSQIASDMSNFFKNLDIGQLVSAERVLGIVTQRAGLSGKIIINIENFLPSADIVLAYNQVAVPSMSLTYVSV